MSSFDFLCPMTRRRALGLALDLAVAGAVGLLAARPAQADSASTALAKYQKDIDNAIDRALAFLARQQAKNGAWARDPLNAPNLSGITSLCVMAFLAKGHTPGNGPYGEVINKGIDYVLGTQQDNGLLVMGPHGNGPMYSHCISSLMLSEVSGMVEPARQKRIDEVLSKAMKLVLAAQQVTKDPLATGGWRYQPDARDSDISITGWALMALRSSRNNGAVVPKEAIDRGVAYVMRCHNAQDGGFGYQPGGSSGWGRTGTALLCLELCGHHRDRAALMAGEWLLKHMPSQYGSGEFFSYAMYYGSQAMFQLGDDYWERWATRLYEVMLRAQKDDGRWPQAPGDQDGGSEFYPTAMAVLAMSVSYRQLPIYQR
jgi:hypothetical protein